MQFFDFQNIRTEKDKAGVISPSHFSLIVDVGRKHKYLSLILFIILLPIKEQGEDYIKVGKCQGRPAIRRTFKKIFSYSARDFVQMMERLHDPAESLICLSQGKECMN